MDLISQVHPIYQSEIDGSDFTLYDRQGNEYDPIPVAIGTAIAVGIWCGIMWRLASKAGYRDTSRWIWFVILAFPFTTVWALLIFILLPWPVQKDLKKVSKQSGKASNQTRKADLSIDDELDQLRKGI